MDFDQIQNILESAAKPPADYGKLAMAWYHWAYYDEQNGLIDSAFQYLIRSRALFARAGDTVAYYRVNADLAERLALKGGKDQALTMLQESMDYFKRSKNLYLETYLLTRMSKFYFDNGDEVKAQSYKRDFTSQNRILKDTVLAILVAKDEVERNGKLKKYDIARYEASSALRLAEQIGRNDFISWGQYTVGYYSFLGGDNNMSLFFLKKAEVSTPRSNVEMCRHIYRQLADTYTALDSLPEALLYAKRAVDITANLLETERRDAPHRLASQFESHQKLLEINQLEKEKGAVVEQFNQQKLGLATLGVALAAVLLALFFIVRDYNHRMHVNKVIAAQKEEINQQKIAGLENTLKIETMQSMLAGQESERQRVAQDLHDSVGGLLAAIKIQMESMSSKNPGLNSDEDWVKIRGLLDDTVSETRHIARNMQPSALLEFGLVTALRDLTSRVHGKGMPKITFQHFGEFEDIDRDIALNCYRIIQELVQNSIKHARSSEILVQITRTENQLALLVEDDGAGFESDKVRKGMGTDNLVRRTQFLKGELSVQSAKGQGTSTMVTIPLSEPKKLF